MDEGTISNSLTDAMPHAGCQSVIIPGNLPHNGRKASSKRLGSLRN